MEGDAVDETCARRLCELNTRFYAQEAASFGASRQNTWPGWSRALDCVEGDGGLDSAGHVLDLAAGNCRFERYLKSRYPEAGFGFHIVDNCPELVATALEEEEGFKFSNIDIMQNLIDGADLGAGLDTPPCTLSVCLGFMHHIPLETWREQVLHALIENTVPGGHIIVSFWQFVNDGGLAAKAASTTTEACRVLGLAADELDEGDYLLGWQDTTDIYRYCHNTTDAEVDTLIESVCRRAAPLIRFKADGRSGDLNAYVVLKRL